jgi:hypothetical protein
VIPLSVKKALKNDFGTLNPVKRFKGGVAIAKKDLGLNKPKIDTTAQDEAMAAARLEQAELDEEENRRRKQLLAAAAGVRAYAGSPMFRAAPSNTRARPARPATAPTNNLRAPAGSRTPTIRGAQTR